MSRSIILGVVVGLFTGIVILILVVAVSLFATFSGGTAVEIPGIFSSWPGAASDGSLQLRFDPNFVGMGVALLVWIAVITALFALLSRPRRRQSVPIE